MYMGILAYTANINALPKEGSNLLKMIDIRTRRNDLSKALKQKYVLDIFR